jgi:hypothetical protein
MYHIEVTVSKDLRMYIKTYCLFKTGPYTLQTLNWVSYASYVSPETVWRRGRIPPP